jgi:hypothetical protein
VALPAAWDEDTLEKAIEAELEPVMADLGVDNTSVTETAVEIDVPSILNVTSVADVTYGSVADVVKVLTIAKWCAWQKAYDLVLLETDLKAGPVDLKDSQSFDHLEKRLAMAYRAASRYSEVLAFVGGFIPVPFAGGLSKSAKQARRQNDDYVQPFFRRTMDEPAGTGRR